MISIVTPTNQTPRKMVGRWIPVKVRDLHPVLVKTHIYTTLWRHHTTMNITKYVIRYRVHLELAVRTTVVETTSQAEAWRVVVSECAQQGLLANTLLSIEDDTNGKIVFR